MSYQEHVSMEGYGQQPGSGPQAGNCGPQQGQAGEGPAGYGGQSPDAASSCACGHHEGGPGNSTGPATPPPMGEPGMGYGQQYPGSSGPGQAMNHSPGQGCGQDMQQGPGAFYGLPHTPPYSPGQQPPHGAHNTPPYGAGHAPPYGAYNQHPQGNAPGSMHAHSHPGQSGPGHQNPHHPHAHPGHHLHGAPGYGPGPAYGAGHGYGVENHHAELYQMVQQAANGQPDVSRFLNFFNNVGSDFWKGALVGAGITLLMTNDSVKNMLAGGIGGLWGMMGAGAEEMEAAEDRKAEAQAKKEGK